MTGKFKGMALPLMAAIMGSVSTSALAADQVIIIGETGWPESAATGLEARLEAAGYEVTISNDSSTLNDDLSNITQIWDVRPDVALSATDGTNYLKYLDNGGGVFLLGENAGFATRNNSIIEFIVSAGGGSITYGGDTVTDQYVTDIFNGSSLIVADSSTSFYVPASGTFSDPGNGVFISTTGADGAGQGTGVAFGAGSLDNAPTGRILTYLDVNTFETTFYDATPALRALIDRMIGFVAGDFQADPDLPPVGGSTVIDTSQPSFNLGDPAATGGTVAFDGGTLDMTGGSDPGNVVTGDVTITENGAFINTAGNSSTLSGSVTGDGGFVISGQGSVALTGANSYGGGTVITDSTTVQIGNADALGTGGVVLMGGRLQTLSPTTLTQQVSLMSGLNSIDTGSNAVTASGVISGDGGFVKSGTGTLTLTGTNSYSGTTYVANGRLAVNGSIGSSTVDVLSGGSVGGNGTVGGLIVRTNATAAPGNSIGQLHAATTVLFEAGSIYQVEADATGDSDRIVATGTATLEGGTVQVLAADGDYQPQTTYTILTAEGGVEGEFADVTSNLAFLMPSLSYGANSVTLLLTRNDVEFADMAATRNQRATATAIDAGIAPTSELYGVLVGQSAQGARNALDSLSGEVHSSMLTVAAQNAELLRRTLLGRLDDGQSSDRLTLWAEAVGNWTDLDGNGNAASVSSDAQGFHAGIETSFGPIRVGLAGGYTEGDLRANARGSEADVKTAVGAVYAGGDFGAVAVRAGASYSDFSFDTVRSVTVGSISQQLTANYGGHAIQAFGEAGYHLPLGIGSVQPFVGVHGLWLKNNAFAEQGGSFALEGAAETRSRAWSTVGLQGDVPVGAASKVSIGFKASWQHALTKRSVASSLAFASGGPFYTVEGVPLAKDAALLDASINWAVSKSVKLGVRYEGSLANQSETHGARAVLSVNF